MRKKCALGLSAFLFFSSIAILKAQNTYVVAGVNVPFQYAAGIEYTLSKKFSIGFNAGIVTKPFDKIILEIMNSLGTSTSVTNTIGESFSFGYTLQPTLYWHFYRKYYAAIYGQYGYLQANNAPQDAIEAYYGVSLSQYPIRRNTTQQADIIFSSSIYNAGLLVGRRFNFKKGGSRFHLRTELAFTKIFGSYSTLSSGTRDLSKLSTEADAEMKDYYWQYGYLPTVNIYIAFRLNKEEK